MRLVPTPRTLPRNVTPLLFFRGAAQVLAKRHCPVVLRPHCPLSVTTAPNCQVYFHPLPFCSPSGSMSLVPFCDHSCLISSRRGRNPSLAINGLFLPVFISAGVFCLLLHPFRPEKTPPVYAVCSHSQPTLLLHGLFEFDTLFFDAD